MKSASSTPLQTAPLPLGDGRLDECTDSEDTDVDEMDNHPLIDGSQQQDSHTRQWLKQEKKDKKKRRNKRIRKRIRRVIRTSWKWFRRGCAGLAPTVNGITLAFGPVFRPYATNTNSSSVYGARP